MDCNKIKEMIPLYMDGMLEEKEMQEVVVHLLLCSDCKKIHSQLSEITRKLNEVPSVTLPATFNWKVSKKDTDQDEINLVAFENKRQRKNGTFNWKAISVIAAVLIMVFALSSEMIEMGTIQPEEAGDMVTMARLEASEGEMNWEDAQKIEDKENYYLKQPQNELGQEIQIEESTDEKMNWEDAQSIEDEESYYLKRLQKELGQEIQIEESTKDAEDVWHFTVRVEETLYKYEGKSGEIWIEK